MQISIARDGHEIGAWTEQEIRRLYRDGQLLPTDHYWREGMSQWEPLTGLCATPPPAPPQSAQPPIVPIVPAHASGKTSVKPSSAATWAAWILPLALAFVVSFFLGSNGPTTFMTQVTAALAGLVVFGGLALLVSIPFPRTWRGAVRCLAVLLLFGLSMLGRQQMAAHKVVSELQDFGKQQREEAARQVAKNGHVVPDIKKTDAEIQKLREISRDENGSDKKLTDEAVDMMQQISTHVKACMATEHQMIALGLSPSKLTSLDELEKRRVAVTACQPPIQDMVSYLQNLEKTTRASLEAKGVSPMAVNSYISGMDRTGKMQALLTYWQMEEALLVDISARLDILKSNWGKWHPEGEKVLFTDDATLTAYNANAKKIQEDTARQKEAQQATLKPIATQ